MSLVNAERTTDFPIQQQQRKCTDLVCTCFGLFFTIVILIISFSVYNPGHQIKTSFPSDSQGRVCGFDLPNFPYIYFANFPKIDRRVCVSSCPSANATRLACVPTANIGCVYNSLPAFYVGYYPNQPVKTSIGSYCEPTNPTLRQQLYQNIGVANRFTFFNGLNSIVIASIIGLVLSFIFMLLVQKMPRRMTNYTIYLGGIIMVLTILFVLIFPSSFILARVVFAILMVVLLVTIYLGWKNQKGTFQIYAEFMNFGTEMVASDRWRMLFVPIFVVILVLFLLIVSMETRSLWSSSPIYFSTQYVFYQFVAGGTTFWTVLVFIQAVWGLTFIKEAFNYCVSGNSVQWYFKRRDASQGLLSIFAPVKYLFFKNFGSVVAGSFMTGWFAIPDYIFDCVRSQTPQTQENPSACTRCLTYTDDFFDLVRSDSMSYIYLTGNPYCNAARYCEYLCKQSVITRNSQSISRFYRICAHFLLAGLASIINLLIQGSPKSVFVVLVVFVLTLFLSTFFISFHADACEAMQIIFLMDEHFANRQLNAEVHGDFDDVIVNKMKLQKQFAKKITLLYAASNPTSQPQRSSLNY